MINNLNEIKTASDAELTTSIIAYSDQIEIHSINFTEQDRTILAHMLEEATNRLIKNSVEPTSYDPEETIPSLKLAGMILNGLKK